MLCVLQKKKKKKDKIEKDDLQMERQIGEGAFAKVSKMNPPSSNE